MRHETCCVVNCKNNGKNSDCKFYTFPQASWKREQKIKWIIAVKRKNADGSPWFPKPHDRICSAHFIGGKKADEQDSPSYVPRIFPPTYTSTKVNANLALARYKRRMERSRKIEKGTVNVPNFHYVNVPDFHYVNVPDIHSNTHRQDKDCQVDIFLTVENEGKTFICNRYIYGNKKVCDAEVQTEITSNSKIINCDRKANTKRVLLLKRIVLRKKP